MKEAITLRVNGTPILFDMTADIYNKYIDEIQPTKKTGPTRNMLMRAVHPDSKDALKAVVDLPGVAMQIAGQLVEKYAPDIEITVGE